jgi:hypothetical protein
VGQTLTFTLHAGAGAFAASLTIERCIIAGWTGRDAAAVERHIAELEALGVRRPATVPAFYHVSVARLTTDDEIEALGATSSGEVEFVLVQAEGRLWVGVGSDHTDRQVETYSVTVSKQMCEKPLAPVLWAFEDLRDHWAQLTLRSFTVNGDARVLYQEGPVTAMRDPLPLVERWTGGARMPEGTAMFCGTLATRGGVRSAERFEFELHDAVLGRTIRHGYTVRPLPVDG